MQSTETTQAFQVCMLEDFAQTAAKRFVNCCIGLIHQRGRIHVCLTGGRTAREVYQALARPELLEHLDVTAIDFYEGDERPVEPGHPDSNWGMIESTLLDPAGVPANRRHRMRGEDQNPDEAARDYEELLRDRLARDRDLPAFDLLLLSVGDDGHVASLFPGTAALGEAHRLVVPNEVPQHRTTRLTLTYPAINAARAVWIFAAGQQKAEIVSRALEHRDSTLPVVQVCPAAGPLAWLLDAQAASKLSPHVINYA